MSAVAAAPARPSGGPSLFTQARWAVSDSLMIAKRNLLVWMRVPAYLVFTVITLSPVVEPAADRPVRAPRAGDPLIPAAIR
jgi:hypothetical protein